MPTEEPRDWAQIAALYGQLVRITRSPVVDLSRAVAVGEAEGPEAGLAIAGRVPLDDVHSLHATREEMLRRLGRIDEARAANARAPAPVRTEPGRCVLERRRAMLDRAR